MVGVPRSKGCRLCVQRRVKCIRDGDNPTCVNCLRGNRQCPGFDPAAKFQDEGPKLREKYGLQGNAQASGDFYHHSASSSLVLRSKSNSPSGDIHSNRGSQGLGSGPGRSDSLEPEHSHDDSYDPPAADEISTRESNSVALSATYIGSVLNSPLLAQLQLLQCFTQSITPSTDNFMPGVMKSNLRWLQTLPELSGLNSLLDTTIRAVTLVHTGRMRESETFIQESRPYYGRALRLLNQAITDKETGMSSETLCSTILLSYYEMFSADSDAAWVRHAGGAGALMRVRGAERHRHGYDREIFLAYRYVIVINAFQNSTPCFLNEPEWVELSRDIHKDIRSSKAVPADKLDIFEAADSFYHRLAAISQTVYDAQHVAKNATAMGIRESAYCLMVYQDLQDHYEVLREQLETFREALSKLGRLPLLCRTGDPIFPESYDFMDMFVGSFHVGHWTVMGTVGMNLIHLSSVLAKDGTLPPGNLDAVRYEMHELALECCRGIHFMIQGSFLGPFFAMFGLRFASQALYGKPEFDWTVAKLWEIGDRRMSIAKFLPWFENQVGDMNQLKEAIDRMNRILGKQAVVEM